MLLSEFVLAAVEHIQQTDYGVQPEVKVYADGYQSDDPEELDFIHASNIKYHNRESDTLIGTYFMISWKKEGSHPHQCRQEAAYLMGMYQEGGWENVDRVLKANIEAAEQADVSGILNKLFTFETAQPHLMVRPLSWPQNRLALKESVYRKVGDIALTLYAKLGDRGGDMMSVKVPRERVDGWSLSPEEALDKALENAAILHPPRLYLSPDELEGKPPYMQGVFMGEGKNVLDHVSEKRNAILTTTRQLSGAAAFFYPGVQERLAELFGCSYYASFTSDSEVMLEGADKVTAWQAYKALVKTNRRFRSTALSNMIFQYDAEKKQLNILNF